MNIRAAKKDYVCLKCTNHYCAQPCCIQFYSNLFYSELFNVHIKDTNITSFGKESNFADIVYTWAETPIKLCLSWICNMRRTYSWNLLTCT